MRRFILTAVALTAFTLGLNTHPAAAQAPTLRELRQNAENLLTTDPDLERYLPRWKIQEADLKIKLAFAFRSDGYAVTDADSMVVTATFPDPGNGSQDLLSIRVGGGGASLTGTNKIKSALGDRLYDQILRRAYQHDVIEPASPLTEETRERIPNVMQPIPNVSRQFIVASGFRQVVQLGTTNAWLEHMIGNDEIGYHFWQSGQGKASLHYSIIPLANSDLRSRGVPDILTLQLGVGYRLKIGSPNNNELEGAVSPRLLNGTPGPKALARIEYRLPQVNDIGFAIFTEMPFSKLNNIENIRARDIATVVTPTREVYAPNSCRNCPDTIRTAYFLRTVAQGMIFWENWMNDYEHFFRVSLGVSYQEISQAALRDDANGNLLKGSLQPVDLGALGVDVEHRRLQPSKKELQDWVYAKVEYLNQAGYPFGLSAQLANRNLMLTAFAPVLKNWLFLEMKFNTPILRDEPAPWEYKSFFMISPVLRFDID
jgi:hypothetical protein